MKRVVLASFLAIIALSLGTPSIATGQGTAKGLRARAKDKRKPIKKLDFTGDDIEASHVRPDGVDMVTRMFATHANLVKIRQTFTKEILRSTEDI